MFYSIKLSRHFTTSRLQYKGFDYNEVLKNIKLYEAACVQKKLVDRGGLAKFQELYDQHLQLNYEMDAIAGPLADSKDRFKKSINKVEKGKDVNCENEQRNLFINLNAKSTGIRNRQKRIDAQLDEIIDDFPNILHPMVPIGDESCNREVYNTQWEIKDGEFNSHVLRQEKRKHEGNIANEGSILSFVDSMDYSSVFGEDTRGYIQKRSDFELFTNNQEMKDGSVVQKVNQYGLLNSNVKDSYYIGQEYGLFDFYSGALTSGPGFAYALGLGARLEQALLSYTIDFYSSKGYHLMFPPDVVHETILLGAGFKPRSSSLNSLNSPEAMSKQVYYLKPTSPGSGKLLAGTSELTIAGFLKGKLYPEEYINSVKVLAISHCFRAEDSLDGAKNRGLYRLHQFTKAELFHLSSNANAGIDGVKVSDQIHIEMLQTQMLFLESLGLSFRVLEMASEELGAPAYRKFDIEAWMPGRGSFGEISSTSNCTDYQSRRLDIKYIHKGPSNAKQSYAHTLNGTACAVPRIIIAIIEQFQDPSGNIHLPKALYPYMNGLTTIPKPHINCTDGTDRVTKYSKTSGNALFSYINKESIKPKQLRIKSNR